MDRRRAAGALLALAACIATTAAAPTASNQTALDLYDESTEGCYYNFQHYGEGDRIMTNEPCLNCTCHNRMLMCYLRVCPFTKAIGQDCTVEKRADQCCPIVTCPDVPVDLLTSTSTSSPAEYGGTGVGKVDKYGCSIDGKYFSEGAKVPPTPGKPCEHCYCIRNMTTCVMQECTLHVDGCTPIYHKDVCCPVRYFCDHPEDEIPLLDDMTTTVRPTQGFLLTTTAPTEAPTTMTPPARRDCIEDDQLYADGALIKTDKPCEHCYCMKGDIVCVVQECGTPMENEGKNCTSLAPREGQCCPDTYICEGDELSTDVPMTKLPIEETITTIVPPRRVSVEGSGYRNEPDEVPYTEVPTFATELEGSGEDELAQKPEKETPEEDLIDKFGPTQEAEFIPLTTQIPIQEIEKATTEPDKGLNTVPSEEKEQTESATSIIAFASSEPSSRDGQATTPETIPEEEKTSESSLSMETTPVFDAKATEPSLAEEQSTESSIVPETESPSKEKDTMPKEEDKVTEPSVVSEPEEITIKPGEEIITDTSAEKESSPTESTKLPSVSEEDIAHTERTQESTDVSIEPAGPSEAQTTIMPLTEEGEQPIPDSRRTTSELDFGTSPKSVEEEITEASVSDIATSQDKLDVTEPSISEQNTVPVSDEERSSEAPALEKTTTSDKTEQSSTTDEETTPVKPPLDEEISEPSVYEKTTVKSEVETTKVTVNVPADRFTTEILNEDEQSLTTEPTYRKEEEVTSPEESISELETSTSAAIAKETVSPVDITVSTERASTSETEEHEIKLTTTPAIAEKQEEKEVTTESIMELSTFAHVSDKESTTLVPETEARPTVSATEKIELPETTTINPADNEIAEVPSPGRIPGEGDCLLEGTTYKNDSIVPSMNKCHSGCKCVSSIIKCDPIICSPPPEDMDNCQPRYDMPEACCPTYVCDHGMETIPPQPQSHITGTESPTPSVECAGDKCEKTEDKQPPTIPSQTPENVETSECGSSGCDQNAQLPAEPCTDNKCEVQPPMELEQPQKIPFNKIPQSCANSEDCKETGPVPCEGESCTAGQGEHCDKEGGCITKPDAVPHEETPQVCANEEECKQVKIPEPAAACEGESCTNIQEDCSTGKCKVTSTLPQPSQQDEKCSEENGCKKPEEAVECENGKCETDKTTDQCIGEECMQQQPISPTQEIAYTGSVNTESPATEQITSKLPTLEEEMQPAELPTTATQEAVTTEASITIEADKDIKEPEHAVTEEQVTKMPEEIVTSRVTEVTQPVSESIDTEQKVTETSPEKVAAAEDSVTKAPLEHITVTESLESLSTESSPQSEDGIKSTEKNIEQPEQITESPEVYSDKPDVTIEKETEAPTEVTKEQIDETQSSELPESHEGTKAPEKVEDEQDQITLSSESPVTEKETKQEEEPVKTSTESPVPELVTEELSKETPRLPETSESTEPSIQESQETKNPDITTISDDSERKTAAYTTSPIMHEVVTVTPSYEKETVSAEDTQTETPSAHVTEPQATVPKEDIDKLTTHVPERSGVEDQDETTTSVLDVAQTVGSAETKLPESEDKYTTTEMPMHLAISDEYGPMENIPVEQEKESEPPIIGLQTTISPDEKETSTLAQQTESEEPTAVDEKETITTTEMTITEKEKQTESPPSHITEQPQTDATTASAVIEQDEVPDLSSTKPQDEEKIKETVSPSDAESTDAPQQSITEKIIPDQEKEEFTEVPTSAVTEPAETLSIEQELSTKTPPITESPTGTAASQETEVPEVLEKTTSIPSQPAISEIEQEKVTAAREPTITEEYEISTEEPEKPEQEEHHTRITEVVPTEQDDLVTKEPEFYVTETIHTHKTTESFEETEKEKATELPVPVIETEGTQKPEITEPIQTESHIPVTEHQKIPERTDEEMSTTESSISEREKTEIPEDFTTKQTFTESPQLHETKQKETIQPGELTTVASHLGDTESEKPSTDQTFEDNLPTKQSEPESPEEQKTENEEIPVVSIPTQEVEGHMTELPEAQQTAAAPAEPASPDVSEATTSSSTLQETGSEEKQTEHPVSVITETEIPSELSPQEPTSGTDKTGQDQDEMQIKDHETKPEELPESPVEISTIIPVPEEDKQQMSEKPEQTIRPEEETTPYSVELEEHTHKTDEEETTIAPSDEIASSVQPGITPSEKLPLAPSDEPTIVPSEGPVITPSEKPTVPLSEESTIGSDSVVPSSEESTVGPLGTMPSSSEQSTVSPLGTVPSSEESTDGSLDTVTSSEESTDSSLASVPSLEVSTVGTLGTVPSSEESTIGPSGIVPSSEESVIIPLGESTVTPAGEANIDLSEGSSITPSDVPSEGVVAPSEEPTGVPLGETDVSLLEEPTTARSEMQSTEPHATEIASEKLPSEEIPSKIPEIETERPSDQKDEVPLATEGPHTTALLEESEKSTESVAIEETSETTKPSDVLVEKYGSPEEDIEKEAAPTTSKQIIEEVTPAPSIETEKPTSLIEPEMEATAKPQYIPVETTAPEEEFIPVTTKATTTKVEEVSTELAQSKPEEKPSELPTSTAPEISKPDEMQPVDEVPSPEDESHFPPSGGYNQEPDYVEEDQAFGPGTCRYGGKVYVSAQQIPRDDPCDFCFCFRSDIICLQQSCPPPIHGCHEEPIQGFCCPRYECPVSMASTLNVTTTTTTTTTTLPPHFLPHAYKGAVTRKGCQIKGHTYQVGEVVRASSGPCLHCTCGGDGQMKCDPKQCTPEPMLRQMIAAAVSAKRRR